MSNEITNPHGTNDLKPEDRAYKERCNAAIESIRLKVFSGYEAERKRHFPDFDINKDPPLWDVRDKIKALVAAGLWETVDCSVYESFKNRSGCLLA